MDQLYNWILFGHIIGATVWFGGHVLLEGMGASARRSGDPGTLSRHIVLAARTTERIMPIAGLMTLGFGIWLVIESPVWEFSDVFVSIGFVMVIVGFVIGIGFLTPKGKELSALIAQEGPDSPSAFSLAKRIATADHIMTGVVFIAMVAMIFKF